MFRWITDKLSDRVQEGSTALLDAVRAELGEADEEKARIVAALAGLMGTIAYADQRYEEVEERRIRAELMRIEGLGPKGVDAICHVLRRQIVEISTIESTLYARELRELADRDFRREVLDALVDIAAADDEIVLAETNSMRHIATALGLAQSDYNESQARFRNKLKSLR